MIKRCLVNIVDAAGTPCFDLIFYGLQVKDFMATPAGGARIIIALRRRGLDPNQFTSSPFLITNL